MKKCTDCDQQKEFSEYYTRGERGLESYCKKCSIIRSAHRKKMRRLDPAYKLAEQQSRVKYNELKRVRRANGELRSLYAFRDARSNDKKKGRDNDLTVDFVDALFKQPCAYCGDDKNRMTLDRIDNILGHLKSNVVASCVRCNITRGQMPYEAWLTIAPAMKAAREAGLFGDWDGDLRRQKIDR